jgi:hypothetical protein
MAEGSGEPDASALRLIRLAAGRWPTILEPPLVNWAIVRLGSEVLAGKEYSMSVDSFFFVRDEKLPTISQWQAALDQAGVGIVLEDVGDLREHTGYLPATHRGHPSGFEWFYGPLADHFGGDPPDGLDGREHVVNCVTHSDMRELVCGSVACSVLLELADGVYFDEESESVMDPLAALAQALAMESQIKPPRR